MMPFDACTSVFTTRALATMTVPPLALMSMVSPLTAFTVCSLTTSADETRQGTT